MKLNNVVIVEFKYTDPKMNPEILNMMDEIFEIQLDLLLTDLEKNVDCLYMRGMNLVEGKYKAGKVTFYDVDLEQLEKYITEKWRSGATMRVFGALSQKRFLPHDYTKRKEAL